MIYILLGIFNAIFPSVLVGIFIYWLTNDSNIAYLTAWIIFILTWLTFIIAMAMLRSIPNERETNENNAG
jgi:hypothetical protein